MAWGRIDDGHWRHRKVAALHDDLRKPALCLFWLAVSWANDHKTDGRVSKTGVRQLDGTKQEADELVRVGLWERDGDAYRIHDFLDFNKSQQQLADEKAQRSLAGQAGASARYGGSSSTSSGKSSAASSNDVPSGEPNEMHAPYPVSRNTVLPDPVPPARNGLPNISPDAAAFFEGMTGRPITTAGQSQLTEFDRQIGDHGFDEVVRQMKKAAKAYRKTPTARQLVWATRDLLEPFAKPGDFKRLEEEERAAEADRAHKARLEATRKRNAELRGDAA